MVYTRCNFYLPYGLLFVVRNFRLIRSNYDDPFGLISRSR